MPKTAYYIHTYVLLFWLVWFNINIWGDPCPIGRFIIDESFSSATIIIIQVITFHSIPFSMASLFSFVACDPLLVSRRPYFTVGFDFGNSANYLYHFWDPFITSVWKQRKKFLSYFSPLKNKRAANLLILSRSNQLIRTVVSFFYIQVNQFRSIVLVLLKT